MFDFIKKLFRKEPEIITESISVISLHDWLDKKLNNHQANHLKDHIKELQGQKTQLIANLQSLQEAEIDTKEAEKVEQKIQNIVLGHKENFHRTITQFSSTLTIPNTSNPLVISSFTQKLNTELDLLAQKTAKSYQAAQHLFFKPVEEVYKNIGEINLILKKVNKQLTTINVTALEQLKEHIDELHRKQEAKENLIREMSDKQQELVILQKEQKKHLEKLQGLQASEQFQMQQQIQQEHHGLTDTFNNNNDEIYLFFSKLNRALRKYEKVTLETKIVRNYLADPVQALLNDHNCAILGVLEGLAKTLEKNELDLNEKQRTNTLKLINKAQSGHLEKLALLANDLQAQTEQLDSKKEELTIADDLNTAEQLLQHFNKKTTLLQEEITNLKNKQQEPLDLEKIKELTKTALNVELEVI